MAVERSFLFVPADRPARFGKALASGADRVIIDLEDAVLAQAKPAARDALVAWLSGPDAQNVVVRVNGIDTPWHADDIAAVAEFPSVTAVMLPKAESALAVQSVSSAVRGSRNVIALVETVRGYVGLFDLVKASGLIRLAFGSVDFCHDSGIRGFGAELDPVRTALVLASRAGGLQPPIEGVTLDLKDENALVADVEHARRFGFGGKLCIHPAQIAAVNRGFSPSEDEVAWARRVIEAASQRHGACVVDGKLVDRPVLEQAQRVLAVHQSFA
jgi:citrate lyase subunit beta/citryl-CoA lyase